MVDDDEKRERVRIDALTEDQLAALRLYDQPVIGMTRISLSVSDSPGDGIGPDRPHIRDHACPVILWRGTRRFIWPNGDVWEAGAANDE